jgi:hypothetical protein
VKSLLPSGNRLLKQVKDFSDETRDLTDTAITKTSASTSFREIYKIALAADAVLDAMRPGQMRPGMDSLRSITRRIPMLILLGQSWVAKAELRRFMELTLWSVFFTHHPVEWEHFIGKRGAGHSKDMRKPIAFAAHRDMNSFAEYALEYMEAEPSGIASAAIRALSDDKKSLHGAVHAGQVARSPLTNLPTDDLTEAELRKLSGLFKRIFSHCVTILCAFDRASFDRLPAGPRAHFDWLVGEATQKNIRGGIFGLEL